jgi:hypothetical protein
LVAVANPGVPEPSSFLPLVAMLGTVFGGHRYRRRSKSAVA